MNSDLPKTRDLVLIGGGHSHALVLRKWGMNQLPGVRLTVIDPAPTAAYSGMLPGFVAGHYTRDELGIDLVRLARFAGARLIMGAATGMDLTARTIDVAGRPPIAFDVAAVDVGITSAMPALTGFADYAVPAKPLTPFAKRWRAFCDGPNTKDIAVIGGGVAGAELAMAMAHALRAQPFRLHLIDRSDILTEATDPGRARLRKAIAELGIEVIEGAEVQAVAADHVLLADGREIASRFTVGAAGARPHSWQANMGLDVEGGYLVVNPFLQTSDPSVFATGDCAHMAHAPRTKAGVYAVRQAPVLFDNLIASLSGGDMRRYDPQGDYLKLISLGQKHALAEKWGRAIQGPLLWTWKDRIDQAFMRKFREYPAMEGPEMPRTRADGLDAVLDGKPMCGGCGAKVGRGALSAAMVARGAARDDVQMLPGDDAGVVTLGGVRQVISTDHLRAIVDDPFLMAQIAAHHALGDIWTMGAAPQAATANLILPRLSPELQARTVAEVMAAAGSVMAEAGAAIVGGHTSMGAEMTLGFTVTGVLDRPPVTLAGARPGDMLVLTKPIGSGVIMAAEMQMKTPGQVVADCLDLMVRGQGAAAAVLRDAHAMTDVTGFGLAGHLWGMAEASGVTMHLDLGAVPLMDGALALAEAGVWSTLLPDNRAIVPGPEGALADMMFDPQTSGGLLAAVPDAAVVQRLREAGYVAAVVGRVGAGAAGVVFE